ncbi:MAG: nitrogenase molybdenum-iron protein alpha chain [Deltaproteobacteria bacterium]|jgi:nitrogenase molybdenum-iron protein alpha chain|nr:nitrogenase molybdenum-iron protein alpha chain [Deltaproteobacteria bacterium]
MDVKTEILSKYKAKVFKSRKEHIVEVDNGSEQLIAANTRAIPGIMTNRGCCYAGCKGVVLGPLKDTVVLTHGPIGCGFYSWGTRRNKARPNESGENFVQYCFSTDMQEPDIVFGGDKKLRQALSEAYQIFKPKRIMICSTCPVGLIGDDIHAVAAWAEAEFGIICAAFSCEGYKGVSQSAGHHIANNGLMKRIIGTDDRRPEGKYPVNLLGEYNIGGDGWETERILKKIGYSVVSIFTGDGALADIARSHTADLNLVQCHRSINYIAGMMKDAFGVNWLKVNFIGVEATCETLRHLAEFFGDEELKKRTEEVIAAELEEIAPDMAHYRERLSGRTAAIFVGGSRSHHYQALLRDLGVETVLAGYEFAHRDDYEGREVIPTIKEDADSKNIENLVMEKDRRYRMFLTPERFEDLKKKMPLEDYVGLMKDMPDGAYVVDDLNHYETEEFIKHLKPDIFFSGIKDKYVIQKGGVLSRQLHSYDYSGPYSGFRGAVLFARDVSMGLFAPAWKMVTPPWAEKREPNAGKAAFKEAESLKEAGDA